jgi:opacity protein-like surface antigen
MPVPNAPQFVPYVGVGIGGMFQRNGAEENSFAYQAMTGVNYHFNNNQTSAGVGYRYLVAPDILDSDLLHFDAESHQVEATLRQYF